LRPFLRVSVSVLKVSGLILLSKVTVLKLSILQGYAFVKLL